jgi:hypothetical protein
MPALVAASGTFRPERRREAAGSSEHLRAPGLQQSKPLSDAPKKSPLGGRGLAFSGIVNSTLHLSQLGAAILMTEESPIRPYTLLCVYKS